MLKGLYVTQPNTLVIPSSTPDLLDSEFWGVCEVDGLGRPDATTYTTDRVGTDASFWSGLTVKSRKITLSVDAQADIYKMELYKLLGYGDKRRMFFETDTGTYWIDGYTTGMKYTASPSAVSEFEIPFYCPYPWFRSAKRHERTVLLNQEITEYDCCNNGDVPSGIQIYSTEDTDLMVRKLFVSAGDNTVGFNLNTGFPTFNSEILLIDTTPGNHTFAGGYRGVSPSNISITGGMPVLKPAVSQPIEIDITADADGGNTCVLCWYDTWSGI